MTSNVIRYPSYMSREFLYELIWDRPRTELSKEFSISDVGLTKKCVKHDIPRPPVGYWAKLAHGKPVERPELPQVDEGLALVEFHYYSAAETAPVVEREKARVALDDPRISAASEAKFPSSLKGSNQLIREFKSSILKKSHNRYGFVESPYNSESSLDVVVTDGSLQRACIFLSGLVKLCATYGWVFGRESPKYGGRRGSTYFQIGEAKVQIKIKEKVTQRSRELTQEDREHKKKWGYVWGPKHEYDPTGILTFSIEGISAPSGYKFRWSDSKKQVIEERLPQIVEALIIAGEEQVERTKDRIERECQYELAAQERRREEARARKEQKIISDLVSLAEEHDRVRKISSLLDDLSEKYPISDDVQSSIREARARLKEVAPLEAPDRFSDIFKSTGDLEYW
ncbi:hypothetical protein BST95_12720 [Halioglobus japonicus]|uniref:Uncharacterized protein n=1 Tax=Halioglobus japonicus TaxID=930805 RepID=A0AAP8SPT4_9GAMM|nr:hypothetical protein [Halioglobus japonicus]AQA18978.1 hypothetical protein BST95_12720 [Halioglobus japonicus]PLW88007.1 hypothetical protein C0029_05465 [Halioglobus japonicus]GHD20439.1 hypothetical protein GCM10007052_30030 [Halioglobus japonicus]